MTQQIQFQLDNYTMSKKLYKDLTSQATNNHRAISEEIRVRLNATLNPDYRV